LRNLLNNAVRYTHAGGVLLRARKRGPWVQCQVWDSGVGVPRQYRHRIFDDHFQAHNDGRLSSEGLGLGLAVVRRLSLLGPTPVRVRSRPGRGSCFSVRLPRLVPAEVLPEAQDRRPVPALVARPPADAPIDGAGARTVVLIDDDPQVREGTALALAQHGWLCAAAANPEDALALLARWQDEGRMPAGDMPCALVSDHRLGLSVTGLEALQQLRYELGEDLPALLLTGEIPALLADAAARANVALASKPLSAEQLSDWLATHTQAAPTPRTTAPHAA
jgi:CheY-like chemotaxis protein